MNELSVTGFGSEMVHAFTVDVEDWHHCILHDPSEWSQYEDRIVHSTTKLMDILDDKGIRATFFVLGWIAERLPHLIREIHSRPVFPS